MRIQNLAGEAALLALRTCREGLTESEARARLVEYGLNVIPRAKKRSAALFLIAELTHFFAIILWAAAFFSLLAFLLFNDSSMRTLAIAIVGVIVINAIFSFWQSLKAERTLEALEKLLPKLCLVLRTNQWISCSPEQLVPGDLIELKEGDDVGADVRLIECVHLRVDTSHITGESLPSFRNALPSDADDLLSAKNVVLTGTKIVSGRAVGVVFATGPRSEFGKMAQLTLEDSDKFSPLEHEIKRVSRWIAFLAVGLGLVCFFLGTVVGLATPDAILFAIGIIVANVPEGLMPTLTLSLALSAQRMAGRNALVRRLKVIETLGAATVICTDKTGTLTQNKLSVSHIDWQDTQLLAEQWREKKQLKAGERVLLQGMFWTHALNEERVSPASRGDPIEIALVGFARNFDVRLCPRVEDIPFDDTRRRQSVVMNVDGQRWLYIKGAPEVIVALSERVITETGDSSALSIEDKEQWLARASVSAQQGLKVLGYARRRLADSQQVSESDEVQLEFLGLVALEDPLREEVPAAVEKCKRAGIRVIMITGDHPETAKYIAVKSGIFQTNDARIVLGRTLEHWSETQLQMALEHREIAFARVRAIQKLRIVEALKNKKEIVAVTGDGVNDAPALRRADIGIAMGLCGTDVARESADIILLDDHFATLVSAIEEGRGAFSNIRKFMTYILSSNVPEAIPYLFFMVLPIPLPLTVLQILAIDLGTDLLPAIGLGSEPVSSDALDRPPRKMAEHLINRPLLIRSYLWLGLWESAAAMTSFFYVLFASGWTWGAEIDAHSPLARQASTATFTTVILMQAMNVLICRVDEGCGRQALPIPRLVLWGIVIEILFIPLFLFVPQARRILQTEVFPPAVFLIVISFMTAMLLAEKARLKFMSQRAKKEKRN